MELMLIVLMFWFALGGLILVGLINKVNAMERMYKDAIRQLNVVAISRGR